MAYQNRPKIGEDEPSVDSCGGWPGQPVGRQCGNGKALLGKDRTNAKELGKRKTRLGPSLIVPRGCFRPGRVFVLREKTKGTGVTGKGDVRCERMEIKEP